MVTRTRYRSPGSVISTIASIVAAIIILGIVLVLIKANPNNEIVNVILDVGRFLTTPFTASSRRTTRVRTSWSTGASPRSCTSSWVRCSPAWPAADPSRSLADDAHPGQCSRGGRRRV